MLQSATIWYLLTDVVYGWIEKEADQAVWIIILFYLYGDGGKVSNDPWGVSIRQQGQCELLLQLQKDLNN